MISLSLSVTVCLCEGETEKGDGLRDGERGREKEMKERGVEKHIQYTLTPRHSFICPSLFLFLCKEEREKADRERGGKREGERDER